MRKIALLGMTAAVLVSLGLYATAAKEKTLTGEIVDTTCYLAKGAKGAEHKACAETCIKGGAPVGLLATDGKLYLLIAGGEADVGKKAMEAAKGLAAETVTAKGTIVKRSGMNAFAVTDVAKKAK